MKKKFPLSVKLGLSMLLVMLGMTALNIFINDTSLERYYIYQKEKNLQEGYKRLERGYKNYGLGSESFAKQFRSVCGSGNYSALIIDENTKEWVSSSSIDDFQYQIQTIKYSIREKKDLELLLSKTDYIVCKQLDNRSQVEYLILSGVIDEATYIYMRTPLESIRESVNITTRFFLFIELGTAILSILVIAIISRNVAKPIKNLTGISKRMKNLDFDAKFQTKKSTPKEVEELGNNMNELSETLEQTILELKAANLRLIEDIRQKEKIDSMRKEFLSNVSHELKTPLSLIQGYAEGLKEGVIEDDESKEYYCDVIMDETSKMNDMVRKLLSLNHLEFGEDRLELQRFDITELILGKLQSYEVLMKQKNIRVKFEEDSCMVLGDEYRIEEVVGNYLSNALNHVDEKGVVSIHYEPAEENIRICVYNSGKTIPTEDIPRIWDKFYKVDKARTRAYGGSGIGLSIVKAIMEKHQKNYGVLNKQGGVEFYFELETDKKA